MVPSARFERATYSLEGKRSIQLSYEGVIPPFTHLIFKWYPETLGILHYNLNKRNNHGKTTKNLWIRGNCVSRLKLIKVSFGVQGEIKCCR